MNAARVVEREREHARASKAEVSQRRHGKRSAARARGGTRGGDGGGEETKRRRDDGRGIDGESLARRGLGARERGVRQGASKREFPVGMPPGQVAHDVAGDVGVGSVRRARAHRHHERPRLRRDVARRHRRHR